MSPRNGSMDERTSARDVVSERLIVPPLPKDFSTIGKWLINKSSDNGLSVPEGLRALLAMKAIT